MRGFQFLLLVWGFGQPALWSQINVEQTRLEADSLVKSGAFLKASGKYAELAAAWRRQEIWDSTFHYQSKEANQYNALGQYEVAREKYEALIAAMENRKPIPSLAGRIYYEMGSNHIYASEFPEGLSWLEKSLAFENSQAKPDSLTIAKATEWTGITFNFLGETEKAVNWTKRALQVKIALRGETSTEVAYTLNSLGIIYQDRNEVSKADSAYSEAYRILQLHLPPSHPHLAVLAGNIASVKSVKGNVEAAKSLYNQAINSNLAGGRSVPLSADYYNLGTLYMHLDDPASATPYMIRAFEMTDSLFAAPHVRRSNITDGLAGLYYMKQDYPVADSLARTALREKLELFGPDHPEVGRSYYSLGLYADGAKNWQAAKQNYRRSLEIRKNSVGITHPDYADVLKGLGFVNWQMNRRELGLAQLRQSLNIYAQTIGTVNQYYLEGSYYLAEYFKELGKRDSVLHYIRLSWGGVFDQPAGNIRFEHLSTYNIRFVDTYVLRLIEQHLLFRLVLGNSSPNEVFREVSELLAVADELLLLLQPILNFDRGNNETLIRIRNIYSTAASLLHKLQETNDEDVVAKLVLHCLRQSRAFTIRSAFRNRISMQFAAVPDSIVHYDRALREQLRYLQAQTKESPEGVAKRSQLEAMEAWRNHRDYLEINHPKYFQLNYAKPEIALDKIRGELQRQEASLLAFFDRDSVLLAVTMNKGQFTTHQLTLPDAWADSVYLYRELLEQGQKSAELASIGYFLYKHLWQPLVPFLNNRVIVIPDGPSHYLSFETLLTKPSDPQEPFSEWDWLLKSYIVHYRHTLPGQESSSVVSNTSILGVAPGFSEELKETYRRALSSPTELDTLFTSWTRTPWSLQFVESLANRGRALTLQTASESNFQQYAPQAGILHFGTHAKLEDSDPLLSFLALTPEPGKQEDGYLYAYELYNQPLNAQLAVLTACETGLGKYRQGEGVLSLAHAFRYAGCPSVVYSLWSIDDQQSNWLMDRFYQLLWDGLPISEALQQAKLEYIEAHSDQLTSPFYWGGIVLTGDNASLPTRRSKLLWLLVVLPVLVVLFLYRRKNLSPTGDDPLA